MPIYLRKSFKLTKGLRLNMTGRGMGLSSRIGPFTYTTRRRSGSQPGQSGSGCFIISLLLFPIQLVWWTCKLLFYGSIKLVKVTFDFLKFALATPKRRKFSLVGIAGLIALCMVSAIAGAINNSTPQGRATATARVVEQQLKTAVKEIEQKTIVAGQEVIKSTEMVSPEATITPAPKYLPTWTLAPTKTSGAAPSTATIGPKIRVTDTRWPTATESSSRSGGSILSGGNDGTTSEHPAGTSGRCGDGSYTEAAHKQGACSHHGGVAEWWGQ